PSIILHKYNKVLSICPPIFLSIVSLLLPNNIILYLQFQIPLFSYISYHDILSVYFVISLLPFLPDIEFLEFFPLFPESFQLTKFSSLSYPSVILVSSHRLDRMVLSLYFLEFLIDMQITLVLSYHPNYYPPSILPMICIMFY